MIKHPIGLEGGYAGHFAVTRIDKLLQFGGPVFGLLNNLLSGNLGYGLIHNLVARSPEFEHLFIGLFPGVKPFLCVTKGCRLWVGCPPNH